MRRVGAMAQEPEEKQTVSQQKANAAQLNDAAGAKSWEGVTIQAMRRALRMRGVSDVNRMTREDCIRMLEEQGGIPDEGEKDI